MVNIVVISHGAFCEGLLSSLKMIAGDTFGIRAVPLIPGESPESYRQKLAEVLLEYDHQKDGFLILADINGGTPFQSAAYLARDFKIGLVSGMNMPMLLSMALGRTEETSLEELTEKASSADSTGIESRLLGKKGGKRRAKLSVDKNR